MQQCMNADGSCVHHRGSRRRPRHSGGRRTGRGTPVGRFRHQSQPSWDRLGTPCEGVRYSLFLKDPALSSLMFVLILKPDLDVVGLFEASLAPLEPLCSVCWRSS
jgi:hypothetical protein